MSARGPSRTLSSLRARAKAGLMVQRLTEVCIRAGKPADAAAIDRLIIHLDELHARSRPDLFCVPTGMPRGEHFLQTALDDAQQQVLVATREGEVIGYAHV